MRITRQRLCLLVLGALIGGLFVGCDARSHADYSKIGLVEVSGEVSLDGEPLPNAVILFEAPDGQFSYGVTDASGAYELLLDSRMSGVTPGEKTVRISTSRKLLGVNTTSGGEVPEQEQLAGDLERVPARYNKASELRVVVPVSGGEQFDFALEGDGKSPAR